MQAHLNLFIQLTDSTDGLEIMVEKEEDQKEKALEMTIEELELSVRSFNCLGHERLALPGRERRGGAGQLGDETPHRLDQLGRGLGDSPRRTSADGCYFFRRRKSKN